MVFLKFSFKKVLPDFVCHPLHPKYYDLFEILPRLSICSWDNCEGCHSQPCNIHTRYDCSWNNGYF